MSKYVVSSTKDINKKNSVILIYVKEFESDMQQIIKQYPDAKVGIYIPKQKIQTPDKLDLILNKITSIENRLDFIEVEVKNIKFEIKNINSRIDNLVKINNLKE